jgi:DNA-binding CsgD family transcriptional regulator
LITVLGWIVADLWWDLTSSASATHLFGDILLSVVVFLGVLATGCLMYQARVKARRLECDLGQAQQHAEAWKREARQFIDGLGRVMDQQFERWKLSLSEREVAMLLLKGLSIKEVAALRKTSERTVRHQTLSIYEKSGLSGRAELSAFFLEDLMVPLTRKSEQSLPAETQRSNQKK